MMLWVLIVVLLALASFFLVFPFKGTACSEQGEAQEENLQIFRDQQAQLDYQLNHQQIDQRQYDQLLAEAQQLLFINTTVEKPLDINVRSRQQATWLLPVALIVMPLFCLGLYHYVGASADQHIIALIQKNSESNGSQQSIELEKRLYSAIEKRAAQRPGNLYYWMLLAKKAIQQNDLKSAQFYYSRAIDIAPDDGYLLGQYAEIQFMLDNSQFTDAVTKAIDKAFIIDSSNPTVLGLKGIQAFEAKQWQLAITYWQEAQRQMEQSSPTVKALRSGIVRAQQQLGIQPDQQSVSPQVKVSVSIDKRIAFNPEQSVYVALVAKTGAPMPLAAKKLRAGDLPLTVTLSNADAVVAGYNLSSVTEVKAVARLSQTGSATPQVGDWEAVVNSFVVAPNGQKIAMKIARQISSQ